MSFTVTSFNKPKALKRDADGNPKGRTPLKKSAKKGDFWQFTSKVLTKFFLKIGMERRCEACDGTAYCGPITPAHSRRRQDIRVGDFYYALRVAVLGSDCHYRIDSKGRREAEPVIERIITERFAKMGLSEERVKRLLLECAAEVQKEDSKFDIYVVTL